MELLLFDFIYVVFLGLVITSFFVKSRKILIFIYCFLMIFFIIFILIWYYYSLIL